MLNLIIGIAVGAAFSPFWMKLWEIGKAKVIELFKSKD
jgi:hypothetical protein